MGPKLKDSPCSLLKDFKFIANVKYPKITSKTCCHGLVDLGFLIFTVLFFDHDLIQSGINLSGDQSPPPITFPALPTQIKILLFSPLK